MKAHRLALAGTILLAVAGCRRAQDPIDRLAALAATNRGSGAAAMLAAWNARELTFNDLLNRAHDALERGEDASAFAGAVLDMGAMIESAMPKGGEHEIFWFRVGRLAFRATECAAKHGRLDEARTLMFAGPARWQTEGYWIRYGDHDALASRILYLTGSQGEAIGRLEARGVLSDLAQEELETLKSGLR
jgi:hypothetical protein